MPDARPCPGVVRTGGEYSLSQLAPKGSGARSDSTRPRPDLPLMERQQSLLFPAIFKKLERGERLRVLDVGPAHSETIHFFSAFRSRLNFADLYSEPITLDGPEDRDPDAMIRAFSDALAIPEGEQFDLCLLWDYPNYLDDDVLQAFSAALAPHLHARSRAHGFAVRASGTRIRNQWYGIDEEHLFTLRPPRVEQSRFYPHPQAILINLLTCFSIERGMLLPDGRLEVSMTANLAD